MNTFKIFEHPVLGFASVKVGPQWAALLLGVFWLLAKRLWGKAVSWFALSLMVMIWHSAVSDPFAYGVQAVSVVAGVCYFALWSVPVVLGGAWCERELLGRGYQSVAGLPGMNGDDAVARYSRQNGKVTGRMPWQRPV